MCHVDVTGVHLISIHAPPRGATAISRGQIASKSFQFPPLCEGRRHGSDPAPPSCHFNSRPSARGDGRFCSISPHLKISIPAPPRGATQPCAAVIKRVYFNSRPSARGDPLSMRMRRTRYSISIHAPPRGATRRSSSCSKSLTVFQFTPLREGRPVVDEDAPHTVFDFNSRPSARGDGQNIMFDKSETTFQFSPLREGRRHTQSTWKKSVSFQFSPLREGRPGTRAARLTAAAYFNSRPSARGDGKRYAISANLLSNPHKLPRFSSRAM